MYIHIFKKVQWDYIILDEAHKIKNDSSSLSINVRQLKSDYRLLLTGTPIQNNIHELWSLMNFLMPKLFKDSEDFDFLYSKISNLDDENQLYVNTLHQILRPFILRRIKLHVEQQLLPKKEIFLFVGMSNMQKQWYKNIITRNYDELINNNGKSQALHNVLMQLRKVCNHP